MSDDHDPAGVAFLGLLFVVLVACILGTAARAEPPTDGTASTAGTVRPLTPAAVGAPPSPACLLPHCAQLTLGQPAPGPGYWYSVDAHAHVGQLGVTALELLDELIAGADREEDAEVDRAAADQAVGRCAKAADGPVTTPRAPDTGSGLPHSSTARLQRLGWVVATGVLVGGAVVLADRYGGDAAGPALRYSAAGGALITIGAIAWAW